MAIDSDGKLTKFKSGDTIVTADFANSIFGGLSGSTEGDSLDSDDPKIIGHIHDGKHADGHAGLINLVNHVDDKLLNKNLADNAVIKRNVRETIYQEEAIPEYDIIDGIKHYYLDLRQTKSEFPIIEDDSPGSAASAISENHMIRQRSEEFDGSSYVPIANVWSSSAGRDFVFGSPSLEDIDSGGDGDNRFFYDKDKGAFRAGSATEDQWDESNRGDYSAAFGYNSIASGASSVSMGAENDSLAHNSSISGGYLNSIDATSEVGIISGGEGNSLEDSKHSGILGGTLNGIYDESNFSSIGGGSSNSIGLSSAGQPTYGSVIAGGKNNSINEESSLSVISGGQFNEIVSLSLGSGILSGLEGGVSASSYSSIAGGYHSEISSSNYSFIGSGGGPSGSGDKNRITSSDNSSIVGGRKNIVEGSIDSSISGGLDNQVNSASGRSFIGAGEINRISGSTHCFVGSGSQNQIFPGSPFSFVGSGEMNQVKGLATHSAVLSGKGNYVEGPATNSAVISGYEGYVLNSFGSTVLSGRQNAVQGSLSVGFNSILSGELNATNETDFCLIASGKENSISQNSRSNAIVSGYQNTIMLSENSIILSGAENSIVDADGSSILGGRRNRVQASAFDYNQPPTISNASGGNAWSYMFGQETRSSIGFNSEVGHLGSFPPATMFLNGQPPTAGVVPGFWNILCSEKGSSQTFVQTMSGHFKYNLQDLEDGLIGVPQLSEATLDGALAAIAPGRAFQPRANSAYAIKIMGVISCADAQALPTTRLSVPFQFSCGISTQPDGTIDYSANPSTFVKIHDSLSSITGGLSSIGISLPAAISVTPTDDFEIFFTTNKLVPTNRDSSVPAGSGFYFVIQNNTPLGGTVSGRKLFGESVSLRLEVTEINLSAYKTPGP